MEGAANEVEVIVFRGDRNRTKEGTTSNGSKEKKPLQEVDRKDVDVDGMITKMMFEKTRKEVNSFGGSGLQGEKKKMYEAERLRTIGAKATRSERLPASVGLGLSKKRKERIKKQWEKEVSSGLISKKGSGKVLQQRMRHLITSREKKGSPRTSRGIEAHATIGRFRDGILHLRNPNQSK